MQDTKIWNIVKNLLKVVITLGALYWVANKISFSELSQALRTSNPLYLILAFLAYCCSILVASSRLNSFFKAIGLALTERYNFRLYQLGLLYNFFLPGGIGGDGYKIFFLKKTFNVSRRQVLGAVFFDRLSGLWALCIVSGALVIFMPRLAIPNYITIAVLAIGTISYLYVLRTFFRQFLNNFIVTHFKALAVQGFQTITAILILYAMNFDGKFSPFLLIFMVSSLVAIVPSIGGAIGLRETVMFSLATYLKLDPHIAVTISLIFYIISLLVASSGIYYIFRPQRLGADKLPSAKEVEEEIDKEEE
ncbi:flippase-like domain-containing protein [Sphingobacterium sp. DK4209]|uniref:Flippase-like domain-containing protein n=1 Tax=Sphingobacterium zhuxiongii TaxID=2662364 RepID=A0A5Q0QCJ3_9SPHI|nr:MULTISPECIES: lysylphosphatidylglycerol synthase transmembrane domain-containing protein [unclassified Sphingobacterium]MVZ65988.1 flippase-like domain-containing protein [Sphingobacterium sp. DK4209]QGA27555.1 flippase-like domain-containing protein [Sphingobacterium sp. dk4302]